MRNIINHREPVELGEDVHCVVRYELGDGWVLFTSEGAEDDGYARYDLTFDGLEEALRMARLLTAEDIHVQLDGDTQVRLGAAALMASFPTLAEDYTNSFFEKAAAVVLEATEVNR